MEIKEARATGLFYCRVEFGEFFGLDKEALWVRMREATAEELAQFATSDAKKAGEAFMALLPKLITESGFTDNGVSASPDAVADIIKAKGTLFSYVLLEWQQSLPLAKGKSTKSGK